MRKTIHQQPSLFPAYIEHPRAEELAEVSSILDANPGLIRLIQSILAKGVDPDRGRRGMSAEQVLRALVAKQLNQWSYDELAFHLADSRSYQAFCRIGLFETSPGRSTLHENISKLPADILRMLNRLIVGQANSEGLEKGRKTRIDCTVCETNIHFPTDYSLCVDVIRVSCRVLGRLRDDDGWSIIFRDHQRRSRRRATAIRNSRKGRRQKEAYQDLLKVTRKTRGYLHDARTLLMEAIDVSAEDTWLEEDIATLSRLIDQAKRLMDQTYRRVFEGETVPANEKLVSIFEPHTDVIVKQNRKVQFGHKLCLSVGASSLVLDVTVEDGNPADSTLAVKMIRRHIRRYQRPPKQVAFDGGFVSKSNLIRLKELGVRDVAFHKKRGMEVEEMAQSTSVYRRLRRFRAGIEGVISWLKRCFGCNRCDWRGRDGYQRYVLSSVLSANLLTMARQRIKVRSG